jgi:hypothetical protein
LITIVDDGKQRKRIAIEKAQPAPRGRRVAWSILQDWGSCDLSSNLNGPTKIHRSFKYISVLDISVLDVFRRFYLLCKLLQVLFNDFIVCLRAFAIVTRIINDFSPLYCFILIFQILSMSLSLFLRLYAGFLIFSDFRSHLLKQALFSIQDVRFEKI